MEHLGRSGALGFPESTTETVDFDAPPHAAEPITRDDLMERSSRHAGVDLHQAEAWPWKLRYEHFSHAQIGHKEVRPLTLARAEGKAGRKVKRTHGKCRDRLLRQVQGIDANDRRPGQHGHIDVTVHVEAEV